MIDTPLSLGDMLGAVARPALASSGGAAVLLLAVDRLPTGPGSVHLLAAAVAFAGAFLVVWHLLPGGLADTRALASAIREMRR